MRRTAVLLLRPTLRWPGGGCVQRRRPTGSGLGDSRLLEFVLEALWGGVGHGSSQYRLFLARAEHATKPCGIGWHGDVWNMTPGLRTSDAGRLVEIRR
jgi:hypothetical protein